MNRQRIKILTLTALLGASGLLASCVSPPGVCPVPEETTTSSVVEETTTTTTTKPTTTTTTTTTTTSTTTSTTVPPSSPQPNGPSGNFNLVFSDEFDGNRLDLNKWRPNWLGGSDTAVTPPVNTLELSCYDPGHVKVADGYLHLIADRNTPPGCRTRNGRTASYASGLIQSNGHFNFTYGYYEARMYLPG